jgi:hypothetical protein
MWEALRGQGVARHVGVRAGVERARRGGGKREGSEREGSDHGGCDVACAEQARRDLTHGVDRRH